METQDAATERRRYMTIAECAAYIRVGKRTLEWWAQSGQGPPSIHHGVRRLYDVESVDRWMREKEGRKA